MRSIVPVGAYNSSYKNVEDECEDESDLADAMAAVNWALSNNAEDFPIVTGFKSLRLVKTEQVRKLPPLRVAFRINPDSDVVELKWIEFVDGEKFNGPPMM
jgi:hypothetical protein